MDCDCYRVAAAGYYAGPVHQAWNQEIARSARIASRDFNSASWSKLAMPLLKSSLSPLIRQQDSDQTMCFSRLACSAFSNR